MNADRSYRIILADDHALFLSGLQGLLSRRAECEVVGTAANGEECLALMQESEHDVVLMDIDMPVLDGIRATERALALNPEEKIITLSMHGGDKLQCNGYDDEDLQYHNICGFGSLVMQI